MICMLVDVSMDAAHSRHRYTSCFARKKERKEATTKVKSKVKKRCKAIEQSKTIKHERLPKFPSRQ